MNTHQTQTTVEAKQSILPMVGLKIGTEVITLSGIRPVETLRIGERIVTRTGAKPLVNVLATNGTFHLKFDGPEVVYLHEGQVHSDTGQPFAA